MPPSRATAEASPEAETPTPMPPCTMGSRVLPRMFSGRRPAVCAMASHCMAVAFASCIVSMAQCCAWPSKAGNSRLFSRWMCSIRSSVRRAVPAYSACQVLQASLGGWC